MSDPITTPETPETKPADSKTGNAPGAQPDKVDENRGEKLFSQAELDAIVRDRLTRAEQKAKTAESKAKDEAEAKAMESQSEFQKLAEKRGKQLETVTAERDTVTAERDALQAKAAKYETALNNLLTTHKAGIPEHVKPLLDRLDPVEQLNWISENGGKVTVNGVPMTPKADGRGLSAAEKEAVQKQADRFYKDGF